MSSSPQAPTDLPIGNYEEIKAWVEALPIINPEKALQQALPMLMKTNRSELDDSLRFRILALFSTVLDDPVQLARKKYLAAALPLAGKNKDNAANVMRFLQEMASGYKLIINNLAKGKGLNLNTDEQLHCLYHAIVYIGRILLENYVCYEFLRPKTWIELNALFRFSQTKKIHTAPVKIGDESKGSIEQAYMRLLLLSAINPYRLMRGEAEKVYHMMGEWSSLCRLQQTPQNWQAGKELIIQLNKDEPPRHAAPKEPFDDLAGLRIVDVSTLKSVIQGRLDAAQQDESKKTLSALAERLQRNMLLRLVDGWKSKNDRESPRIDCTENLELAVGLKTCHFVLGESRKARGDSVAQNTPGELNLIPKTEDMDEFQAAHYADKKREAGAASQFEVDDPHHDIWAKQLIKSTAPSEPLTPDIKVYPLIQTNQSAGGVSAHFEIASGLQPRVGELVCFRSEGSTQQQWKLGAIRWLIFSFGEGDFGIQTLAEDALPIAVKALSGVGKGGDRLQALLIGANSFENPEARLIVPATLYDVGTVLYVESAAQALKLTLTKMKDTTESFSCFAFAL